MQRHFYHIFSLIQHSEIARAVAIGGACWIALMLLLVLVLA